MYSYTPTQLFALQQQQQQSQHLQHAMYAHQQQGANLLFHQYNQLLNIQAAYTNPTLTPVTYTQQPIDQQQQQQLYRTDQLVAQSPPQISSAVQQLQLQQQISTPVQQQLQQQLQQQIPTPVQQQQLQQQLQQQTPTPVQLQQQIQQQLQQQMQRSSPINMMSMPPPKTWLTGSPLAPNSDVFHPIPHPIARTLLDLVSYNNRTNSIASDPPTPPTNGSYDSPKSTHRHYSKQQLSPENRRRRQRLNSGSSCYESDLSDSSNDDDDEFEWRPVNSKTKQIFSTKKQSNSMGRSENDMISHDIYQNSYNNSGVFPAINSVYHSSTKNNNSLTRPQLIQYIDENLIGKDHIFNGPWGLRRMIYCDYTASGRPLEFIEKYIRLNVLPLYGNTHSETSLCAQQSTKYREEARNLIKKSVNANENDVLLFVGTGSTGAVHQLLSNFDLHDEHIRKNTIVMISAFEHHSNLLPWKETGVELIRIPTTQQGILDKSYLKEKLQHYSKLKKRIICSLNAASNITGIYTDVDSISSLVHSYSGFIFWDYATSAPYVKIDMNPSLTAYKDAIFISTHKFLGGPGTPGILIAKKNLFSLKAPKSCGGGTVNFVTRKQHEYNHNTEIREEGGTPDIIGCIRAGLVFQLKDSLDMNYIHTREDELVKRFFRRFKNNQSLIILGSQTVSRLPIFSFAIYIPGVCKYLHHNLVCRLFNDLFGIQVRSGCACAGPYALDLLNVNNAKTDIYCMFMTEDVCIRGNDKIHRTMMMKPGFTRLNLPFFVTDNEIDYILDAVEFIATHGWKFLPLYTYNPATASWSHRNGFQLAHSSLEDITYKSGKMQFYGRKIDSSPTRGEKNLPDPFREAKLLAADAVRYALESIDFTSDPPLNVPDKYKSLVWFALPIEIALMMFKQKETGQELHCDVNSIPFIPDDAKERIINSTKTKTTPNRRSTSIHRNKTNANRSLSTARVR